MTNSEIKEKFEEILRKSPNFDEWVGWIQCSTKEMSIFKKWLNQLSEEDVCKYLEKDGSIISVIENQTNKICETSINQDPCCIKYIKNQNNYLCELAIIKNAFTIPYIREQTVDLCLLALETNPNTSSHIYRFIRIVPNPDYYTTLKNLLEKKAILEALK